MKSYEINHVDIEREARRLRAAAMRGAFVRLVARLRGLSPNTPGQTAH